MTYPNGFVLQSESITIILLCKYGRGIDHIINYPIFLLYLVCYLVCLLVTPHYNSCRQGILRTFLLHFLPNQKVISGRGHIHIGSHTIEPSYSPCGSSHPSQAFQWLLSNLSLFHCLSCPTTSSLLSYDISYGSLTPFRSRMCETWQRLWSQTDLNLDLILLPPTVWTWANVKVSQNGELVPLVNSWFLIPLVSSSVSFYWWC